MTADAAAKDGRPVTRISPPRTNLGATCSAEMSRGRAEVESEIERGNRDRIAIEIGIGTVIEIETEIGIETEIAIEIAIVAEEDAIDAIATETTIVTENTIATEAKIAEERAAEERIEASACRMR